MTAEASKILSDPNFAINFAAGDPFPVLVKQDRASGIRFAGKYFNEPKRYVLKSGHMSSDDQRLFDHATGKLVMNSHHPGKVRYQSLIAPHFAVILY